jgi:uncharacterized protein (TIGR02145 family)
MIIQTKFIVNEAALKRSKLNNILCAICTVISLLLNSCNKDEISLPTVSTISVTNIATITATSGGNILTDGGNAIVTSGICWSLKQNPSINDSITIDKSRNNEYSSSLSGLLPNTTYYLKAYATNSKGTAYGNEISFKTNPLTEYPKTVTDSDGNLYHTVRVNNQVWLIENLRSTKYRNGDPIINITEEGDWSKTEKGAYCWYRNKPEEFSEYGILYNLYAITDSRSIAPKGCHVPSLSEYRVLIASLGGINVAGGKLKEPGFVHWESPNNTDSNPSNFNALPGGYRNFNGGFNFVYQTGTWWSSSLYLPGKRSAYGINLGNKVTNVGLQCFLEPIGAYVRCLID